MEKAFRKIENSISILHENMHKILCKLNVHHLQTVKAGTAMCSLHKKS